jgi:hypothetical protein
VLKIFYQDQFIAIGIKIQWQYRVTGIDPTSSTELSTGFVDKQLIATCDNALGFIHQRTPQ